MHLLPAFVGTPRENEVYNVDVNLREKYGIIKMSSRASNAEDVSRHYWE